MINAQKANILAIIPARYASTRFPGKPLALIHGKSMISRVVEQVKKSDSIHEVIVATDDARIFDHVSDFGGKAVMTSPEHQSGTDRCAEIAAAYPTADIVLNVQGDEPFIQAQQLDLLVDTLLKNPSFQIATLAKKISSIEELDNPNVVKLVMTANEHALYFSRYPIPYSRSTQMSERLGKHDFYKHIGLYGFHRQTLLEISKSPPSPLELSESLEQLRWLENGYGIAVGITDLETIGIDTPEDLERV